MIFSETRLRSLMTYRQARPHVEKRDDDAQRMSRQDRARSSVRQRRARSASITRHATASTTKTTSSSEASTNAIVITREHRRARLKIDQKDVSDDSGANLSPDITDSDTRIVIERIILLCL